MGDEIKPHFSNFYLVIAAIAAHDHIVVGCASLLA